MCNNINLFCIVNEPFVQSEKSVKLKVDGPHIQDTPRHLSSCSVTLLEFTS